MIISELYLPNTVIDIPAENHTSVIVTDPEPYLHRIGLSTLKKDSTLSALLATVTAGSRLPIHKDLTVSDDQVEWSIIIGGAGLILEIYTEAPTYKEGESVTAPAGTHPIPVLPEDDAVLIEQHTLGSSPVMFNPYTHWHSAYNPTDTAISCISIRSRSIKAAQFLDKYKKK